MLTRVTPTTCVFALTTSRTRASRLAITRCHLHPLLNHCLMLIPLAVVVMGSHLIDDFGNTWRQVSLHQLLPVAVLHLFSL